jgi:hypothetical protein
MNWVGSDRLAPDALNWQTMTIASFVARRRMIAWGAATLLLHYLAVYWVGAQGHSLPDAPSRAATTVTAQLRPAPLVRVASATLRAPAVQPVPGSVPAGPPKAKPKLRPKPNPRPKLVPKPEPASDQYAAAPAALPAAFTVSSSELPPADVPQSGAIEPVPAPAPQNGAPDPAPEVTLAASATASAPAPDRASGGAGPAAPAPARRYKVSLPPSAELALDVVRVNPDGAVWNGEGAMAWRVNSGRYTMSVEAGIRFLVARVNLLILTSEGILDDAGIAPVTATERRRGRAQTATHFNRGDGRITFSASERSYPLLPGAQDKATLPMQLAGIGRAGSEQLNGDIEVLVGEDKEANTFRFVVVGQEQLETKLGTLQTWHLSRPPKPGTYSSRLDVWLAPARDWYPVQIRNSEANGAVTTQTVTNIIVNDLPEK